MEAEKIVSPKSWRDVYKVHPAADIFPMLPKDELRKLGEDIKANGLKEPIVLWSPGYNDDENQQSYLLDGRNRLAAMDLVGVGINEVERTFGESRYGTKDDNFDLPPTDPYAYVISKNIRRRHLTKEQQADLIVRAMKMQQAEEMSEEEIGKGADDLLKKMYEQDEAKRTTRLVKKNDLAKAARSFSPEKGKRGGSTKDSFKEKVVNEAKKHDISKRTAEKAIAKNKGPTQKDKGPTQKEPEPAIKFVEVITGKPSRSQLLNLVIEQQGKITKLQRELLQAQTELTLKQWESLSAALQGIQGLDLGKLRRDMAKKYHPDGKPNSNKTYTADEVMAIINQLIDELARRGEHQRAKTG